jgi:hypothetical protein
MGLEEMLGLVDIEIEGKKVQFQKGVGQYKGQTLFTDGKMVYNQQKQPIGKLDKGKLRQ